MSRSGTYPTIGQGFKVEKYGAEAVRDVGGKGAPKWRDSPSMIPSYPKIQQPFRKVPDKKVVSYGFTGKSHGF